MKKIMIFAAMTAMFSLASCQKEEVVANNEVKGSPVFTAVINSESTKTTVAIDGNKGKISWEQTDEITITDSSTPTPKTAVYKVISIDETTRKATFEIKSGETALGAGPYTATYGNAPSIYQTYSATAGKLYMTASTAAASENDLVFTVQCGLMKLNLTMSGETITNIAVTGTPTGGTETTYTLYCSAGEDISSGKDFYIALPAGSYNKIEVYKHDATNGFMVCSLTASKSIEIADNRIKPVDITISKTFTPCEYLPGMFSVSATKKVHFSKGNLYAKKESEEWKWHFYDEQYEFLAADMEKSGSTDYPQRVVQGSETEIHLFTWGYSEATSLLPIGETYVTDHTTAEDNQLNPSTGGDDWGVAYCNSNSITVGTWRTLTIAEWQYLFNTRTVNGGTGAGKSYSLNITYGGKMGVVLYPDGYSGSALTSGTDYTDATFPAGCVFLPAAGSRYGSYVNRVGVGGDYWSSTAFDEYLAYDVHFTSVNVPPDFRDSRYYGYSVRLITESK